jgi:hypothetical protein
MRPQTGYVRSLYEGETSTSNNTQVDQQLAAVEECINEVRFELEPCVFISRFHVRMSGVLGLSGGEYCRNTAA